MFSTIALVKTKNTVLKLAAWLKQMGYFKKVNFVFLIVGHTKIATDSLFNSLKHEYRKKNLFTMQDLITTLNVSESVMVVPTIPEDFLDYDAMTNDIYHDLSGMIKQNHMFFVTTMAMKPLSNYVKATLTSTKLE